MKACCHATAQEGARSRDNHSHLLVRLVFYIDQTWEANQLLAKSLDNRMSSPDLQRCFLPNV
jgi:hypothetical protein